MTWFLKILAPAPILPSHYQKYLLMGLLVQSSPHMQRNLPSNPKLPPLLLRLPKVSTEVNSIQSIQTSGNNKKKGKNRNKKPGNQQETPRPTNSDNDKGKRKEKYPCLLCGGDHFSKECPHRDEISHFLKSSPTPTVLTDPFPSQQKLIDHVSNQGNSSLSK